MVMASSGAFAMSPFESHLGAALKKSSFYRVRYLNPAISPRTIYDVLDINKGGADFDVTVKCFPYTCEGAAKFLTQLAMARETKEQCIGPSYLRIDFLSSAGTELSISTNYSGACMMFGDKSYLLPSSIIWKFYQSPLKDW
jgi:hypothetical protein